MSEEKFPTQEEQEEAARAVRWPELRDKPEVDSAVVDEIEDMIGAQMVGGENGS